MKLARFMACSLMVLPGLFAAVSAAASEPGHGEADRTVAVGNFDHELLAREIFRATNEARIQHGAAPLKPEPRLVKAADEQAAMLAIRIHGGHDNPLPDHGDPFARVVQAGLHPGMVGENAATMSARNRNTGRDYTYRELAAALVQAWMDSPGHRANLLSREFQYLGCSARAAYLPPGDPTVDAIQAFYTPAPSSDPPIPTMKPGDIRITH
jgi:uncharacterized protein YkwD